MTNEKVHALYSPSASKRWMNCPGSIALSQKAPPARDSEFAKEGTEAHALLEKYLRFQYEDVGEWGADMASHPAFEHVMDAAGEIRKLKNSCRNPKIRIETPVDLGFIDKQCYGTVDIEIADEWCTLHVIDYKHGAGIAVEVENNTQLLIYALGIAHAHDYCFTDVKMTIIQPRAFHPDGPVRSWTITIEELQDFADTLKKAIKAINTKNAALVADPTGEWCRFCPAAVICPELTRKSLEQAMIDFSPVEAEVELPDVQDLSENQLSVVMANVHRLETWVKSVKAYAYDRLLRGIPVPGQKLVAKRADRKWTDLKAVTAAARKEFGETAFHPAELKSPAQLEKIAGKDWVNKRVSKVSSGVTMVHESDKRPPVNPAMDDFADIEGDNGDA